MPTSFTTNLRLSNPGLGDTGWGSTVSNGMIDLVDPAISGTTSVSVTAGNVTLTSLNGVADQARQMFLVATGTPGVPRDVIVPSTSKLYFVKNDANDTVTFKVLGQPGVAVPAGSAMALRVNGTDVVVAQDQFVTLKASGATTLAALTASGNVSFDGGAFVFNESGADKDARFEGDTDANLLFLDASTDRVGIGTATPAAKLDVNGPASVTSFTGSTRLGVTVKGSTAATDYSGIDFSGNNQIVPTARIAVLSAGSGSSLVFGTSNNYATGVTNSALVISPSGDVGVGVSSPAYRLDVSGASVPLRFNSTNNSNVVAISTFGTIGGYIGATGTNLLFANSAGSEAARITSAGQFLVGTTSASSTSGVGVKINPDSAAPWIATVGSDTTSTNASYYLYSTGAGAYRFYVGYNGTVFATSTTITAISDGRLKENIRDLDAGLPEIMALKPRRFDWKPGKGKDKKNDLGWIAQEFEQVFPDMIYGWKDPAPEGEEPYKAVNADLIPVLVKAVQEQQALITNLIERVRALEAA